MPISSIVDATQLKNELQKHICLHYRLASPILAYFMQPQVILLIYKHSKTQMIYVMLLCEI
jgi:hypothetical protein